MRNNYFPRLFVSPLELDYSLVVYNLVPLSDEFVDRLRRLAQYMAQRKKLSDWLASLYSDYSDIEDRLIEKSDVISKAYMIGGTMLSVVSLVATFLSSPVDFFTRDLLVNAANGVGWNVVDSVGGVLLTPKLFHEAKKSLLNPRVKTALAWTNAIYFSTVLPGLSLWGFATLVQSVRAVGVKAVIESSVSLGAPVALAASGFAFAGGMFVAAAISGFGWYSAVQKSNPVILLRDRLKKHDILQKKIEACQDEAKKAELKQKSERIKKQAEALAVYCNTTIELQKKLTEQDKKHSIFAAVTSCALTSDKEKLAGYLIQKQQDKVKEKRFETILNVIGGVGALCGGLASLIPPLAIPLLIGSVVFFALSSAMKAYQLYEKHQLAKKKKESAQGDDALVKEYFNNEAVSGLSKKDETRIASKQCLFSKIGSKTEREPVPSNVLPLGLMPGGGIN